MNYVHDVHPRIMLQSMEQVRAVKHMVVREGNVAFRAQHQDSVSNKRAPIACGAQNAFW